MVLVWYCQFDVSPVNYSDSDSDSDSLNIMLLYMYIAPGWGQINPEVQFVF